MIHSVTMMRMLLTLLCLAPVAAGREVASGAAEEAAVPQLQQDDIHHYYLGRSTRGTWRNVSYTIFHYAEWKDKSGPSRELNCARQSLENAFASTVASTNTSNATVVEEMTLEELQQVLKDVAAAERDEEASEMRPSRDTMRAQFSDRWGRSGGRREPLDYMVEASVALYLKSDVAGGDFVWVDAFGSDLVQELLSMQAIPQGTTALELETFVVQEAKNLASPGIPRADQFMPFTTLDTAYYARRPLTLQTAFYTTEYCVQALNGEYWEEQEIQDKFFTYNTVVGRSVSGLWGERPYEILSYIQLFNVIRLNDSIQETCFHEVVDSLFVDTDKDGDAHEEIDADDQEDIDEAETTTAISRTSSNTAIPRNTSNTTWTSSVIMELTDYQKTRAKNVTFEETAQQATGLPPYYSANVSAPPPPIIYRESIYWTNSDYVYMDGYMGEMMTTTTNDTFKISFQSGVAVYLDGKYIQYFPDVDGPEGELNAFIKEQLANLLVQNEQDLGLAPTAAPARDDDYEYDDDFYVRPFFVRLIPALLVQECNVATGTTTASEKNNLRH